MFVLLFTFVFGGAISGSHRDYLQFALPGIIVQNAIFATLTTGVGLSTDLTKGVYDRLRSLPIARWAPLSGRIVADTVKQVWAISLLLGVGALIGFRVHGGVTGVIGVYALVLVFTLAVSWLAVLVGVMVDNPEKVQIFGFVVTFPLTFTSNAFVPTDTMPGWLQAWVKVNPVTILADAVRGLFNGVPSASAIGQSLLWALVITPCSPRCRCGSSSAASSVARWTGHGQAGCHSSIRLPSGSVTQPNRPTPSMSCVSAATSAPLARSCASIAARSRTRKLSMACWARDPK